MPNLPPPPPRPAYRPGRRPSVEEGPRSPSLSPSRVPSPTPTVFEERKMPDLTLPRLAKPGEERPPVVVTSLSPRSPRAKTEVVVTSLSPRSLRTAGGNFSPPGSPRGVNPVFQERELPQNAHVVSDALSKQNGHDRVHSLDYLFHKILNEDKDMSAPNHEHIIHTPAAIRANQHPEPPFVTPNISVLSEDDQHITDHSLPPLSRSAPSPHASPGLRRAGFNNIPNPRPPSPTPSRPIGFPTSLPMVDTQPKLPYQQHQQQPNRMFVNSDPNHSATPVASKLGNAPNFNSSPALTRVIPKPEFTNATPTNQANPDTQTNSCTETIPNTQANSLPSPPFIDSSTIQLKSQSNALSPRNSPRKLSCPPAMRSSGDQVPIQNRGLPPTLPVVTKLSPINPPSVDPSTIQLKGQGSGSLSPRSRKFSCPPPAKPSDKTATPFKTPTISTPLSPQQPQFVQQKHEGIPTSSSPPVVKEVTVLSPQVPGPASMIQLTTTSLAPVRRPGFERNLSLPDPPKPSVGKYFSNSDLSKPESESDPNPILIRILI